ncbi:MAG: carboxymuconolactone decarboxylase family protein [Candidatus Dormibacteraceae bacterium]
MLEVAEDPQHASVETKVRVLLDFASKLSREPAGITRADWDGLLASGWSRQQAIEAIHIVGLFEYLNRVADGFGMEAHGADSPFLLEHLHQRPHRGTDIEAAT